MVSDAENVVGFWFADSRAHPETFRERQSFWFAASTRSDALIRRRFAHAVRRAAEGDLDAWGGHPTGVLALILLLDQFPRNIYRGTARAFASDGKALHWARAGIRRQYDATFSLVECGFLYMPFQHAEDSEVQSESRRLYQHLRRRAAGSEQAAAESFYQSALEHQRIIDTFGRFPHRNEILGRPSTPAERRYLGAGGKRYGQHG